MANAGPCTVRPPPCAVLLACLSRTPAAVIVIFRRPTKCKCSVKRGARGARLCVRFVFPLLVQRRAVASTAGAAAAMLRVEARGCIRFSPAVMSARVATVCSPRPAHLLRACAYPPYNGRRAPFHGAGGLVGAPHQPDSAAINFPVGLDFVQRPVGILRAHNPPLSRLRAPGVAAPP